MPHNGESQMGIPPIWLLLYDQDPNAIAIASAIGPNIIHIKLVFMYRHLKVLLSSTNSTSSKIKTTTGVRHQNETINIEDVNSNTL